MTKVHGKVWNERLNIHTKAIPFPQSFDGKSVTKALQAGIPAPIRWQNSKAAGQPAEGKPDASVIECFSTLGNEKGIREGVVTESLSLFLIMAQMLRGSRMQGDQS